MIVELRLPYPHKKLNPNERTFWREKSKLVKKFRMDCCTLARRQPPPLPDASGKVRVALEFLPPDNRRRDLDNAIAAFKAGLDGLADAWGIDDSKFAISFAWGGAVTHGGVIVRYETIPFFYPTHKETVKNLRENVKGQS